MDIEFHPEAHRRFNELAVELRNNIRAFADEPAERGGSDLYPVVNLTEEDIIGSIKVVNRIVDGTGRETGRVWTSSGRRVGWQGSEFKKLRELARRLERTDPLQGKISIDFLIDEIFEWLKDSFEGQTRDAFADRIAVRTGVAIKPYEIWIPLFQTYSDGEFAIGTVRFRKLSKAVMEAYFERTAAAIGDPDITLKHKRIRSRMQGSLAACVEVTAERQQASAIALSEVQNATSFLRFLDPANLTVDLVSHCVPLGMEKIDTVTELLVSDGVIAQFAQRTISVSPIGWNVDEVRSVAPGLLESLQSLAADNSSTDLKRVVYDALILYSRGCLRPEVSDRLVFVLAALESVFLRDSNEPIQKNLGQRMAFMAGKSKDERKAVFKSVQHIYQLRSRFIHHGSSIEDAELVDVFLLYAWTTFSNLVHIVDRYKSKDELIEAIDDRLME
jgi:hypothetical protein